MDCPQCGAPNEDRAKFCYRCRAELPANADLGGFGIGLIVFAVAALIGFGVFLYYHGIW